MRHALFGVLILMSANAALAQDSNRNTQEGFEALLRGDQKKFFEHALKDAEGGLKEAQLAVASIYERGAFGMPANHAEAFKWYSRAAEAGQPEAELSVGRFYLEGKGIAPNLVEGNRWLERASAHGNARASDFLGDSYLTGRGVTKDPAKAVSYYLKAAEANVVQSQVKLAGFYFNGTFVSQDKVRAYFWARVAQSNPEKMPNVDFEKTIPVIVGQLTSGQRDEAEKMVAKFVAAHSASKSK